MAIKIDDTEMASDATQHTACQTPSGAWRVTWLPGFDLNRNEAITAMVLADHVGNQAITTQDRIWPFVEGWAAELGMSPEAALLGVRKPPEQAQRQA
jgi:hypothetical protein